MLTLPRRLDTLGPMTAPWRGIGFGGDYNPEQWPREVWDEDVRLMREAGVSIATVGVFAWALIEPRPGEYELDWLAEVLDLLHENGIGVDLATATASPPPWLARLHPQTLPVTADGTTLWPGARQAYCPSSPIYRERALALCRAVAERFADHPALLMWHVSNEIGCHNSRCYCDVSAAAFRRWLEQRYGTVEALNEAWGTSFWSQRYGSWDEVLPPRVAPNFPNPTQQLDFHRFSSDELLSLFEGEKAVLAEVTPGVPVTTNLMVMPHIVDMDYLAWGPHLDIVSNDHYPVAARLDSHRELAFSADLTRGIAGGEPWMLMEQSSSAVNWQPRNVAKRPGELLRASFGHVARGADAVLFFQWRASRAGAEKFHSALLPHAGTDSRVWREVLELGRALQASAEVAGSRPRNAAAIVFDWNAWWACELDSHPSIDVRYREQAEAFHTALTDLGIGVDVVHPSADLSQYALVCVPTLYLVDDASATNITDAAERGAVVCVTFFSGIVDEHDHIRLGGYPGAFRDLLGVRSLEFTPLREGETVALESGAVGRIWAEDVQLTGAEVRDRFVDGPVPGGPAITRAAAGHGSAWYVATRLDDAAFADLVAQLADEAGLQPVVATRPGVEVTRRVGEDGRSWVFAINHTDSPAELALQGVELLTDTVFDDGLTLAAGGVAVVRER